MISVSVEVCGGSTPSRATVQAESISEAVSITKERYPGHHVRVMFPIEPEDFFGEGRRKRGAEAFSPTALDGQGGA